MKARLLSMRILLLLAGGLLAAAPSAAFAHENVGGDELAAANWMLIGAFVVALTGIFAGLWAWRTGQFTNVEDSKYRMLDTAEDYDAIMAEAEARERVIERSTGSTKKGVNVPPSHGKARI